MSDQQQNILEAALMVAGRPLSPADLQKLFDENEQPTTKEIREILQAIADRYNQSGIELKEVASGFQFQARKEYSQWLAKLWEERPPRYSRALLETLALIAYRQPITRGEIEEIRGVAVNPNILKTLQEREWIRSVGYRDTPGKPELLATTKTFLDHLNLKSLQDLPPLSEITDFETQAEKLQVQLELVKSTSVELPAEDEVAAEESAPTHEIETPELSEAE